MKKVTSFCKMLALIIAALHFSGCKKIYDQIAGEEIKHWRIKKITQHLSPESEPFPDRVGVVEYNQWSNPVRVVFNTTNSPEDRTNWEMRYNDKHRLTDAIQTYLNGYFFSWKKFMYSDKGVIYKDSTFIFGTTSQGPYSSFNGGYVSYYYYDNMDRIIKIQMQSTTTTYQIEKTFSYDTRGNLIKPGTSYDNKVNPQRTNRIWMFLAQNYSVNNAIAAEKYNEAGLPLKFRNDLQHATFLLTSLNNADIEYEKK